MHQEIDIALLADCQEHIPYLSRLWHEQLNKHWIKDSSLEKTTQSLIEHAHHELPITFVALKNNKPVGMASLRKNDGLPSTLTPWLGSLVVDSLYRQHKIGEKLIETVKKSAASLGHAKLHLFAFDETIPTWYEKLGWKIIATDTYRGYPIVVMSIDL